jgi:predicted Abi (CAAX) family protease
MDFLLVLIAAALGRTLINQHSGLDPIPPGPDHVTVTGKMLGYLKNNVWAGLKSSPRANSGRVWIFFAIYAALAGVIGFSSGLLTWQVAEAELFVFLPLTLLIFPALLEEIFFRGILIPRNIRERGPNQIAFFSLLSAVLFVLWHPLNALTINPTAKIFFLNPLFLVIVFLLGLSCSLGYIYSRSLWVPVIMHWLTVMVWVLLLGGRNLLVE